MDRIIFHSIYLNCSPDKAFEFFTTSVHLEQWLAKAANVESKTGGKYELFWNPDDKETDSTIGCKILAIEQGRFLCFEWKGPKQFKHFMNNVRPLTNVIAFFFPHRRGTEVHLLHTGWRDTDEWEEARHWFDEAWKNALSELQRYVNELK